jgi:hypothetical protein
MGIVDLVDLDIFEVVHDVAEGTDQKCSRSGTEQLEVEDNRFSDPGTDIDGAESNDAVERADQSEIGHGRLY